MSTQFFQVKKVGLVATTGTGTTRRYQRMLKPREVPIPEPVAQEELMDIMCGDKEIKLGFARAAIRRRVSGIARLLINRGPRGTIAGCTKLTMVIREEEYHCATNRSSANPSCGHCAGSKSRSNLFSASIRPLNIVL